VTGKARQTPPGARSNRTYGSLPQKVRVDRLSQKATFDQEEWTPKTESGLQVTPSDF